MISGPVVLLIVLGACLLLALGLVAEERGRDRDELPDSSVTWALREAGRDE